MNFFITGGTGFIGQALVAELLKLNHRVSVVTRNVGRARQLLGERVELFQNLGEISKEQEFDWVINLAGAGIADRPWTEKRKQVLRDSRILFTQQLVDFLNNLKVPPAYMISASAVGFYGDRSGELCSEAVKKGDGFAADLCAEWEEAAMRYEQNAACRGVYILRLGVVLASSGGLLQRVLPVYKLGMGTIFGSGKQNFAWVHLDDVISAMQFLIKNKPNQSLFNLVASTLTSQRQFAKVISCELRRPLWIRIPTCLLSFTLREQAALFLDDAAVVPEALQALQFEYSHPDLSTVLD